MCVLIKLKYDIPNFHQNIIIEIVVNNAIEMNYTEFEHKSNWDPRKPKLDFEKSVS